MSITSSDIHNQSFGIDRKGYSVDEVDEFLERVAKGIDELNMRIGDLERELEAAQAVHEEVEEEIIEEVEEQVEEEVEEEVQFASTEMSEEIAQKSALIEELQAKVQELETMLSDKKADDSAISQALIVAQRSADDIVANANSSAAQTIQNAEMEADRIIDRAESERLDIVDSIKELEECRLQARKDYEAILKDFIGDATQKLAKVGEKFASSRSYVSASERFGSHAAVETPEPAEDAFENQDSVDNFFRASDSNLFQSGIYSEEEGESAPMPPKPAVIEKDLSGFGEVDEAFDGDEID